MFGHTLQHVPVLHNLAILIEPEDVDACPVCVSGPLLKAVQDDAAALGNYALEVNALAWILLSRPREVCDEPLFAIGDVRIVLDVHVARVLFDSLGGLALIEHQVIGGILQWLALVTGEQPRSLKRCLQPVFGKQGRGQPPGNSLCNARFADTGQPGEYDELLLCHLLQPLATTTGQAGCVRYCCRSTFWLQPA